MNGGMNGAYAKGAYNSETERVAAMSPKEIRASARQLAGRTTPERLGRDLDIVRGQMKPGISETAMRSLQNRERTLIMARMMQ